MMKYLLIALMILPTLGLNSAHSAVLAQVGDDVITLEFFNKKYDENKKYYSGHQIPTRKNVLDDMINRLVGIREAKRRKLHEDPAVKEQMETTLYHALVSRELTDDFNKIKVRDSEVKDYYSKNPEVRTSHIFVKVNPGDNKNIEIKAKKRAEEIYANLAKTKKSFAEIANAEGDGTQNKNGGDIGYQRKDQLDPAYYQTALKMKVGSYSKPVRTQFGWHIIKLTGVRKSLKDVNVANYKRLLFDMKRMEIFKKFFTDLRGQSHNKVNINKDLL